MSSSYRLPKSFKQATLDTESVDADSLSSKKQQLWHFTFPQEFNVAAFSELELHLPAEPISSATQVAQHVASFELDGASYRIIEGSVFETSDVINLFPSASAPGQLEPGKPFSRCFRICRDVIFPAPPKPIPVNPRGRAPNQVENMRKNFFPIGYISEQLGAEHTDERAGRYIRETSARPQSPRLLPHHGFDINEWHPSKSGSKSASTSDADAARKREKKEAKKRSAESAAEPSSKKQKAAADDETAAKKKKSKKEKQ